MILALKIHVIRSTATRRPMNVIRNLALASTADANISFMMMTYVMIITLAPNMTFVKAAHAEDKLLIVEHRPMNVLIPMGTVSMESVNGSQEVAIYATLVISVHHLVFVIKEFAPMPRQKNAIHRPMNVLKFLESAPMIHVTISL